MTRAEATYVGSVEAVSGGIVSVLLRDGLRSSLLLVGGESYRVGQIGAFMRIPLGYAQLYGVCTQVGAAAIPVGLEGKETGGQRWL